MSILSLIIAIVVVGLIMWAINAFIPMEARIKQILKAIGAFAVLGSYRI